MALGVVYIEEGESSLIKVTVSQSGVSERLALGGLVALPSLVARPWESTFNGQQRHGIARTPADAWGVHAFYVTVVKPGVVELRLVGFDFLRKVRMPRRTTAGLLKVAVALREDATAFVRDSRAIPHQLTLGTTLAGKSIYLRALVAGLAPQPVAPVGIDCNQGVELAAFASRLSAPATDPDQAAELLPVLVRLMEERYDLIRARQGINSSTPDEETTPGVWGLPASEQPVPVVLFVNEVAELLLVATKKKEERRDERVTHLIHLAQLGRAAGIYLEVSGQPLGSELDKEATMLRAQSTGRVCHRVNDEASAKMALSAIAPERPGLAVAGDTSGGWSRIRTPYLSLGDAAAICDASANLVPELPALQRFRPAMIPRPAGPASPLTTPKPTTG